MLEEELTAAILTPNEELIGFLHPGLVDITEYNEIYGLKSIDIAHPFLDEVTENDVSIYDEMLVPGNKVWRNKDTDGEPCLYVLLGEKTLDYTENTITISAEEIATELSQNTVFRDDAFSITVNETFINDYYGNLFNAGTLSGPGTTTATNYSGALTPMALLRKIEELTGGEFQFRYAYEDGIIERYIDYLTTIGTEHTTPISLDYNSSSITVSVNEAETRIGAAPVGEPSTAEDEFHVNRKAFEDQVISKSVQIPSSVTTDENGNPLNGPMVYPPYAKSAGQNYVVCDEGGELVADYYEIQYKKSIGVGSYPRIYPFSSTEANPYNMYWECVNHLRQYLEPEIKINCTVLDLQKLSGLDGEHYKVGDTVYIMLPGRDNPITARITKTTKNPRNLDDDTIEIGNYQSNFLNDYLKTSYNSAGMIDL